MINKTILLILCFSFISLIVGIFIGYKINPIKEETVNDLDYISENLNQINDTVNIDTDFLMTKSFVSILVDLYIKIKNEKLDEALSIIESSLIDIRFQIVNSPEEELNDDEKLLIELIESQIVNNKNFEGK